MFLKNLISLFISTLLASVLSYLLNHYSPVISSQWDYSILYFAVLCFIFNLVYAANVTSVNFTQLLIGGIVIKLLLALSVIVVYSFLFHAELFHFSIHFMLHYVLFTIFETRYLLQLLKTRSTKPIKS